MDWITVKNCPLCAAESSQLFDQRTFRLYPVENRLCTRCGFVFQSPRLSDQALDEFYATEYRLTYQGSDEPTTRDVFIQEQRAAALGRFLHKKLPTPIQPASLLDIGSSGGLLLDRLGKDYALRGVGVEPGDAYRYYAGQKGWQVVASLNQLEPELFGMVSMVHVLEHLPDPLAYLQALRRERLAPTGYLLVEVPNLYAHDSFEIAHLSAFSLHTLTQMLVKAGYTILAMRRGGAPRSRVLPLYITVLAKPAPEPIPDVKIHPDTEVRLKRRLGMLRRRVLERLLPGGAWLAMPGEK